jgi:hypothetical protein
VVIMRWFQVAAADDTAMASLPNDGGAGSQRPEIRSSAVSAA